MMYKNKKINLSIVLPIFMLAIVSIITIYSASTYISKEMGNLALKQSIWYLVGIILVFILIKLKRIFIFTYLDLIYFWKYPASFITFICS